MIDNHSTSEERKAELNVLLKIYEDFVTRKRNSILEMEELLKAKELSLAKLEESKLRMWCFAPCIQHALSM